MKRIALLTTVIALTVSACQPQQVNQVAQQQHFVCKSLIEGFLKTQHLGGYQLDQLQPSLHQTASTREYRYRADYDQTMKLNAPRQQDLKFQCRENSDRHFEITLLNTQQASTQPLLSLDLPPQKSIDNLTASVIKTQ